MGCPKFGSRLAGRLRSSLFLGSLTLCVLLASCGSGSGNSSTDASSSTTVPGTVTSLSATAGSTSATIAFTAPSSDGGSTITSYTATCTASGVSITGTGTASPITVSGLTNGTSYTCSVTAANANGSGAASQSVSVTPAVSSSSSSFTLTSTAVTDGGTLPAAYTCDGTGSTLPLSWVNPPTGTVYYALLLSTSPTTDTVKYDWVLYDIDSSVTSLEQDSFLVGTLGQGDDGPGAIYDPPCSQGPGAKQYTFTLYALSAAPSFSSTATVTGSP